MYFNTFIALYIYYVAKGVVEEFFGYPLKPFQLSN